MGQKQSPSSLSLDRLLSRAYQPFTLSQGDGRLPARSGRRRGYSLWVDCYNCKRRPEQVGNTLRVKFEAANYERESGQSMKTVYRAYSLILAFAFLAIAGCGGGGGSGSETPSGPAAPTVSLSVNPAVVPSGEATTLAWSSTNATDCVASGDWAGSKATSGSEDTSPLTSAANFSLSCSGPGGSRSRSVTVNIAPTLELEASPQTIIATQSSTLTWTSSNVTSCTATGDWSGSRALSGSEATATLATTSTFGLSCIGPGGTVEESAAVEVFPITDPPQSIRAAFGDGSITVSWSSPSGTFYAGFLRSTNVYVSTSPNIDVATFIESPLNQVIRGLTIALPVNFRNLTNGTPVYIVATDEVNGVQTAPTPEISVTPEPVPLLVENIVSLNDTGVLGCADETSVNQPCPQLSRPNQDADQGRDAAARNGLLVKTGFGPAGFDLTKLDANGDPLPDDAATWPCIRDNVTGLIWEVPGDSGLTSAQNTYTWYQPDPLLNGGDPGLADGGSCTDSQCDTHAFIQALNAAGLCGFQDWRLPTRRELFSLADFSRVDPAIPDSAFPSKPTYFNPYYWTSNTNGSTASVGISAWAMGITTGALLIKRKSAVLLGERPGSILAVRAGAAP